MWTVAIGAHTRRGRSGCSPGIRSLRSLCLVAGLASCAPGDPPRGTGREVRSRAEPVCVVGDVERRRLTLDGRAVYVDPQVLLATASGFLVAGSRSYEWSADSTGAIVSEADRILGLIVDERGVRAIPRPRGPRVIRGLRAAPAGDDRWRFLLEEVDGAGGVATGVWSAELGPTGWSVRGRLPLPEALDFWFHAASALVAVADGAWSWTLPVALPRGRYRVVEYRDSGGGWGFSPVDSSRVEMTTRGYDPRWGVWSGIVGLDPDLPGQPRTFRVHLDGAAPGAVTRLHVAATDELIHEPSVRAIPDGLALAWITRAADGASVGWGAVLGPDGAVQPTPIDSSVVQSTLVVLDDHPLWLLHHAVQGTSQRLDIHMRAADGDMPSIASFDHPYTGYFAAIGRGDGEVVIVGPEFDDDPMQPTVRSLVLRLSVSCQ